MKLPEFLVFASDAEITALLGMAMFLLAAIALLADRVRVKRARIDRVGWVPWTGLFLTFAVLGGGLLFLAAPGLFAG